MALFILLSGCNGIKPANTPAFYGEFCNAQRTSYKDVNGLKETPKAAWKYKFPYGTGNDAVFFTTNAPTIEGNIAYFASGNVILAINIKTGKEIWKRDYSILPGFNSIFFDSPVIYKDKIVIVGGWTAEQFLIVADKNTGKPIWKSEVIGGDYTPGSQLGRDPLVVNGRIYFPATSKKSYEENGDLEAGIWVWDINSGKVLDKISIHKIAEPIIGKQSFMEPGSTLLAVYGSNIYGATQFENDSTNRTYVFCYDTSKKKFTWFTPIERRKGDEPGDEIRIAVNKNFVTVWILGNPMYREPPHFYIYVFDKASHKLLWQNITRLTNGSVLPVGMCAIRNDKLYAMTFDKRFVCFDMKTGSEVWSFKDKDWKSKWWNGWNEYGNCFLERDVVATKDVVYFNAGNAIYAFDPDSGKLLWRKIVKKNNLFIDIMPVDNGLIVRYQDYPVRRDVPQNTITSECWR